MKIPIEYSSGIIQSIAHSSEIDRNKVFEKISDVLHLYIQATNYLLDLIELHGITKKLNTKQMVSIGHIKALDKSLRENENKKISD